MTALRVMVRITSRGGFHFFLFTNKGVPIFRLLRQIMPPDEAGWVMVGRGGGNKLGTWQIAGTRQLGYPTSRNSCCLCDFLRAEIPNLGAAHE
jgi:hypothetical protein